MSILFPLTLQAAEQFVNFTGEGWLLNEGGKVNVFVATADKGVLRAANDLCNDLSKVCGATCTIAAQADNAGISVDIDPKNELAPTLLDSSR